MLRQLYSLSRARPPCPQQVYHSWADATRGPMTTVEDQCRQAIEFSARADATAHETFIRLSFSFSTSVSGVVFFFYISLPACPTSPYTFLFGCKTFRTRRNFSKTEPVWFAFGRTHVFPESVSARFGRDLHYGNNFLCQTYGCSSGCLMDVVVKAESGIICKKLCRKHTCVTM